MALRTGSLLSNLTVTRGTKGGIVVIAGESPEITSCTISGNDAIGKSGGGVCCELGSSPKLTNCTISGNTATAGGGGVYCWVGSTPILTNCTISGNAANYGGGVDCEDDSSPTLTNCVISGNSASWNCGGVFCWRSSPILMNCTISGNWGKEGGGVDCGEDASPTLTNCIVWDNPGGSISHSSDLPGNPVVSYCSIQGDPIWPGQGNINQDPLFVQPGHLDDNGTPDDPSDDKWIPGDYHIQSGSPCIDAGTCGGTPVIDIEGRIRPCGTGVDIGAYEYGNCWPTQAFIRGDPNSDGSTDLGDAIAILFYAFMGEPIPCKKAADADNNGKVEGVTDAIFLLRFLFLNEQAPDEPLRSCGIDQIPDELTCDSFPACP